MALAQRLLSSCTNPNALRRVRPSAAIKTFFMSSRNVSLKSYIVTPKELSEALTKNVYTKISTAPRVVPVCAAWFLPNDPQGRTGHQVFKEQRIPTARFFDLDAVKDHASPYPHMLPTAGVRRSNAQDRDSER